MAKGMNDFRSFTDDSHEEKSTIVAISAIEVEEEGDLILVRVEGSHFLWKMVRRIVGVMVEIGKGGLSIDAAARFLQEDSPMPARLTAPASGLFLERVYYRQDRVRPRLRGLSGGVPWMKPTTSPSAPRAGRPTRS